MFYRLRLRIRLLTASHIEAVNIRKALHRDTLALIRKGRR